jgi:malate dehydrogenase (oxaloacetate-decarboxylating)(NADP+)
LQDPTLNKGTAFSKDEREALGLRGLLPPHVCSQDEQIARVLENFHRLPDALEQVHLPDALHDRNEALFFRLLIEKPDEMLPIVYTPTVGQACQKFGKHLSAPARPVRDGARPAARSRRCCATGRTAMVSMIVVTDGERILAWATSARAAWAFPSASCACTPPVRVCPPSQCLPVMLDVGTNNERCATIRSTSAYRSRA